MTIDKELKDEVMTMKIIGALDTQTAPELEAELDGKLDGVHELIFDFSELEYVSSAGLRVIIQTKKAMLGQGDFKLIHVNKDVMNILEITGFTDMLTIEE